MARRGCFDPSLANHVEPVHIPARRLVKKKKRRSNVIDRQIAKLRAMPYLEYLKTDHWRRTRNLALKRAQRRCKYCGQSGRLEVHHLAYERRGCEKQRDLIVLCSDCHKGEHQDEKPWLIDSLSEEFRNIIGAPK